MAKTVAEFIDGDTTILVETAEAVAQQSPGGMGAAGIGEKLKAYFIKKVDGTFTDAMSIISYTSNTVLNEIKKIDEPPASADIQFGVKITGEGKAMLASGGVEATCTVKLSWKKPE
ncbi:MAG: hypothetical protein GY862_30005 [Gammaproteobacteria bacterium]|nr:hypothetical protein [Gammaproteobacteria bacterium]